MVSPIIGTILMVGLTVILAATIIFFVLSYGNIDMKDTLNIIYNR